MFIVILILPMLLLACRTAQVRQAQELDALRQQALTVARAVASQQARTLEQVQEHLRKVAHRAAQPESTEFARNCPQQLPALVGVRPSYLNVGFADESGRSPARRAPWVRRPSISATGITTRKR